MRKILFIKQCLLYHSFSRKCGWRGCHCQVPGVVLKNRDQVIVSSLKSRRHVPQNSDWSSLTCPFTPCHINKLCCYWQNDRRTPLLPLRGREEGSNDEDSPLCHISPLSYITESVLLYLMSHFLFCLPRGSLPAVHALVSALQCVLPLQLPSLFLISITYSIL